MCTEQPSTRPYFEKMLSTSDFFTTAVFRLPINTRELMDFGSVLLVTLLVWTFSDMLERWATEATGRWVYREGEVQRDEDLRTIAEER